MSLNSAQRGLTAENFEESFAKLNLTDEMVAADLQTTAEKIHDIRTLTERNRENVWILRNYLLAKFEQAKIEALKFDELVGNHHDYWFLDVKKIDQQKIK